MAIVPLSFAAAIVHYRLLDLDIFLKRATVTVGLLLSAAVTYAACYVLMDRAAGQREGNRQHVNRHEGERGQHRPLGDEGEQARAVLAQGLEGDVVLQAQGEEGDDPGDQHGDRDQSLGQPRARRSGFRRSLLALRSVLRPPRW